MHTTAVFEVTSDNFQSLVLDSALPVLVDFGAEWCPPCKILEPIVDQIARAHSDHLRVGSLDVDVYPEIQERYGVMGLPTLILFQNGEPVQRMVGFQPRQLLEAQITPFFVAKEG